MNDQNQNQNIYGTDPGAEKAQAAQPAAERTTHPEQPATAQQPEQPASAPQMSAQPSAQPASAPQAGAQAEPQAGGYEYRQAFPGQGQQPVYGNWIGSQPGRTAPGQQPAGYQTGYSPYQYSQQTEPKKEPKRKKGGAFRVVALVLCCCIVCATVFGFGGMTVGYLLSEGRPADPDFEGEIVIPETDDTLLPADQSAPGKEGAVIYEAVKGDSVDLGESDVAAVVYQKASPSVVEITTEVVATSSFIGQYVTEGAGSGVVLSANGYIMTNNHVISGADNITVRTADGKDYKATLIGTDDQSDIAILKVEAEDLTPCVLGYSSELVVGQRVFAIGNPLGTLGGSITDGIVSALSREVTIDGQTMTLLQTNTAINPGNSGGGLFNANGELVAVVNAKSAGTDIEGLGFAIPIDSVRDVIDQLIEYGYIRGRAALNITYVEITSSSDYWTYMNSELGRYITDYGVYVVTSKSDALQLGDRIVAFNGVSVSLGADIKALLSDCSVGDVVEITVVRNGRMKTVEITLGEYIPQNVQIPEQQESEELPEGQEYAPIDPDSWGYSPRK